MRILFGLGVGVLCLPILLGGAFAQIPRVMSYQGVLVNDPPDDYSK